MQVSSMRSPSVVVRQASSGLSCFTRTTAGVSTVMIETAMTPWGSWKRRTR